MTTKRKIKKLDAPSLLLKLMDSGSLPKDMEAFTRTLIHCAAISAGTGSKNVTTLGFCIAEFATEAARAFQFRADNP